jgi:hypothetical protein
MKIRAMRKMEKTVPLVHMKIEYGRYALESKDNSTRNGEMQRIYNNTFNVKVKE